MSVNSKMTAIADAIREKSGKSGKLTLDDMAVEIQHLSAEEIIQHADIPDYVKDEALRVAGLVEAERKSDSIVFLAMSDNHHYGDQATLNTYTDPDGVQTDVGNLHAAMAAKILAYALKVDFMAQLGDSTWGHKTTTSEVLHQQAGEFLSFIHEAHKDIPCFHAIGNHDTGIYYHNQQIADGETGVFTESGEWLYNNFTALSASENTVFGGESNGGYCYRDFPDKKLRVFLLNTSEALVSKQSDSGMLGSQRKWFADALVNLNSKSDASTWSFIILSHYPADYGNTMPLSELLKAYVQGSSISISLESGSSASVSFSGKNSAKMVAQFHGHVHNFLTSKLYSYATGKGVRFDAWRICIPNGQYNRENYYTTVGSYTDISFAQETTYSKIVGTAKDTSFVVNVVTPSEQKITSICYGAGINRVIGYAAAVYYTVTASLSNVTLTGGESSVEEGEPYTATLTIPDGYEWKTVKITMGGTDVTAAAYSNGAINIAQVTGNIVITASAAKAITYVNQLAISTDASSNIYNGKGWKENAYLSSGNEATRSGSYLSGFISCVAGDVIRFKNCSIQPSQSYHRFALYKGDKTYITNAQFNTTQLESTWISMGITPVYDDDGYMTQINMGANQYTNQMAYIRFCCGYLGENSIVTVNEEIT